MTTFMKRVTIMQMKHRMYFGLVLHSEQSNTHRCTKRYHRDEVLGLLYSKSSSFLYDIYGSLTVKIRAKAKGKRIMRGVQNLYITDRFRVISKIVTIINSASIKPYLVSVFAVPRDSLLT